MSHTSKPTSHRGRLGLRTESTPGQQRQQEMPRARASWWWILLPGSFPSTGLTPTECNQSFTANFEANVIRKEEKSRVHELSTVQCTPLHSIGKWTQARGSSTPSSKFVQPIAIFFHENGAASSCSWRRARARRHAHLTMTAWSAPTRLAGPGAVRSSTRTRQAPAQVTVDAPSRVTKDCNCSARRCCPTCRVRFLSEVQEVTTRRWVLEGSRFPCTPLKFGRVLFVRLRLSQDFLAVS